MLICGGTVFADGAFQKMDVRLCEGRIAELGELTPRSGERTLAAEGLYVLPGFVDIHIHGFAGHDCMRGEADVRAMSDALIKTGVSAFMPTTMSAWPDDTHRALSGIEAVMDRPQPHGAAVLGAHMEAPFLAPDHKGAQRGECLQSPSVAAYEQMTRALHAVRMMTLAPELEGAIELIRYLCAHSVVCCAAHSGAQAAQVHAAADAGLSQISHLFNAQTPLHHREPGVPGAGLADERLIVQVIADGIHLHPDILRIAALCKGAGGVALISDSMEAAGLADGEYDLGGQSVTVRGGAARLHSGVLAGSTLKLHQAVRNMIVLARIAPQTVIPMATSTPADAVGAKGYGRIEPGAAGVLALMDGDWHFASAAYEGCPS